MKTNTSILLANLCLLPLLTASAQTPLTITRQPTNQSVSLGASTSFVSLATSTNPPLTYQWRLAATNLPARTNATLSLTNIQVIDAGDYDVVATDGSGSVTSLVAQLEVDLAFTKITAGSLVTDLGTGIGCAWGDYDNDGFIDLIVTSGYNPNTGTAQKNLLFRNNQGGNFIKVTNTVVTVEARDWRGCTWVDYDNDGHLDLYVTSTDGNGFTSQDELFRNNGDGSFTKMTATAVGAIVPGGGHSEGPVWSDYDRDGFVDAFVVRYGPDWLFHNNGDGSFVKVPYNIGIPSDNYNTYRAAWGDYDNDGWPDLLRPLALSAGCVQSLLYHGRGNGTFTNVPISSVTNCGNATSGAWADYDNDGYLDLFVARFGGVPHLLYHNNGNGTFTAMTSNTVGRLVSDLDGAYDCTWGDYDNDGFIDLFVSVGGSEAAPGRNLLYHNNAGGSFTRVLSGSLVNDPVVTAPGCTWGDYDNDGFLDLFVVDGGHDALRKNLLYRNNGNSNAWIKLKLVGVASNRSAIGAKVRVQANLRGNPTWQLREVHTGTGFGGGSLLPQFGLGDATNIDQVRIEWPSGIVQTLSNVAPNQTLTVVEHQTPGPAAPPQITGVTTATNGSVHLSVTGESGLLYVLGASTSLANWTKLAVRSNATGLLEFTDPKATNYPKRFYRVSIL